MDEQKIGILLDKFNELDYEEKSLFYSKAFSIGVVGDNLDDLLILLSLTLLTYLELKKKQKITPLAILLKITGETDKTSYFYNTLENLSIIVEDLSHSFSKSSSCGLKNSNEIITKIKDLLNTWTPF